MSRNGRLEMVLEILQNNSRPVKGGELAILTGVSRQMIVKYIEKLRETGYAVESSPRGYFLTRERGLRMVLPVKHSDSAIYDELSTIISQGGRVLDVIIIHPVYGEIRGELNLFNMDDLNRFIAALKSCSAVPLLNLSQDGVHLHTIEADSRETLERVKTALANKGYLAN